MDKIKHEINTYINNLESVVMCQDCLVDMLNDSADCTDFDFMKLSQKNCTCGYCGSSIVYRDYVDTEKQESEDRWSSDLADKAAWASNRFGR